MKQVCLWFSLLLVAAGCYQRPDPVVQAAQNLERMAYNLAAQEDEQIRRLSALRLGMSDSEVLNAVGPPSKRASYMTGAEESREVWMYRGALRVLAILTFVNRRLEEIRVE